ncbi:MAG: trypsin-like peptidase domain-containing protein [Thermomicrobiales bacterium]|jgi:S1-C subfamily serine protease|nr:trypsin-like peptidase domain-containing protein [Thermomicrobiales bacterium]
MSDTTTGALASFSNALADAVEHSGAGVATVNARRRMPATGIVWAADGLIVSANHVVERDDDITITLADGATLPATILGRDPGSDIVLLQVDRQDLTPAPRAMESPRPGHIVLAVGRPGKGGLMASLGVVSLIGGQWRNNDGINIESFIRSDAAMLPGFSGGPLVDSAGGVLGMNSSTLGRRGGLTIPIAAIDKVVSVLRSHGKIRRGFLGIGAQSVELNAGLRSDLGTDQERALLIVNVQPDGPAEQSGLLIGDVILSIGGQPVATVEQLQDHLTGDIVGQPVDITLIRGGALANRQITASERGS